MKMTLIAAILTATASVTTVTHALEWKENQGADCRNTCEKYDLKPIKTNIHPGTGTDEYLCLVHTEHGKRGGFNDFHPSGRDTCYSWQRAVKNFDCACE